MVEKVLVAMSGGVDSSVAAYLLREEGFEVSGITMCLGVREKKDKVSCCDASAIEDARRVARKLGIPHYIMDFSRELQDYVVKPFVSEYLKGRTPNPCIECNRYLKFGLLLEKAKALGFDFLATGHYAQIERKGHKFFLKKARDNEKDQSYFLYSIKREALNSVKFPLGKFTKQEVRTLARKIGLEIADKPQSQDICFLKRDYREFLLRSFSLKEGEIVDLKGNVLGKHKGIAFYTIGQREGLGISAGKPLYVVAIEPENNRIVVGEKKNLEAQELIADNLNMLVEELPQQGYAKIRYRHKEAKCRIFYQQDEVRVVFYEVQEAITPGQSIVFYQDEVVLGGAIIKEVVR